MPEIDEGMIRITTTCEATIWRGFFGKNERGDHDECPNVIVVEVDDERDQWEKDHGYDPGEPAWLGPVGVECGACGSLLEWPQRWTEAEEGEECRGAR